MASVGLYLITSVVLVSLASLAGLTTLLISINRVKKYLLYLISFSAGILLGDVFIHILPEIIEIEGFSMIISFYLIFGIALFFILEKIIHLHHHHIPGKRYGLEPFAIMNLIGDAVHNFLDGIIIGASYLLNLPIGVATTIAVIAHEIPQEIGDFGILIKGGFSVRKAVITNLLVSLTPILGIILTLSISTHMEKIVTILMPIAAGGFIYIACTNLIPEMQKEIGVKKSVLQLISFFVGVAVMLSLTLLE